MPPPEPLWAPSKLYSRLGPRRNLPGAHSPASLTTGTERNRLAVIYRRDRGDSKGRPLMGTEIWRSSINRRDFLRGTAAIGLGGTAAWLAAACRATPSAGPAGSPSPLTYAKAQVDGDLTLFNWSQYMSPDVIDNFATHYG